ncbi:D-lactaldehyde dehydrogenase [Coprinopsis sp. MPI-PUGE-AT-0042]|nr:D-lactaldehyde dehydrogenase [Coprinopsis sp. MPI-PUGE-AT-0042]
MPTIPPGAKVLVTGANGYIAMWIVRRLLERGYFVRATVRSTEKGAHMVRYFKSYGAKLEISVVPDFTQEGAFDEAVKGMDAIEHTASPIHWNASTPRDVIDPAVNGTLGILKSAQAHGRTVKRIVITSSIGSIHQKSDPDGTFYDDKSWNDEAVREVEEKGDKVALDELYYASKTLAERAAWDFYEKNKRTLSWDLTILNIPWVLGPPIQEVSTPSALNGSMKLWWNMLIAPLPGCLDPQMFLTSKTPWSDVRDVADSHILSLEKAAAGGERIIVTSGDFAWPEWVEILNALDPSLLPRGKSVSALPETAKITAQFYDASKVNRILGVQWVSMEQTARDIMADAAERGW